MSLSTQHEARDGHGKLQEGPKPPDIEPQAMPPAFGVAPVSAAFENNPIPRLRESNGNVIPRKLASDGPVPDGVSLHDSKSLQALFYALWRRSPTMAHLLAYEYEHTVLPRVKRLRAVTAIGQARRAAFLTDNDRHIGQARTDRDTAAPLPQIETLKGEVAEAEKRAADACAAVGCSEVTAEAVLDVGPPPTLAEIREPAALCSVATPPQCGDSQPIPPSKQESNSNTDAEPNKSSGPEVTAKFSKQESNSNADAERSQKPIMSAWAVAFMTLVVGLMTGLSIFAITHWYEPGEGISAFLSPSALFVCSQAIGLGVATGTKYAVVGAWREVGLLYGMKRSAWAIAVSSLVGTSLVGTILLLDGFTHREGFMVGARIARMLNPAVEGLSETVAFLISMIIMVGYATSLAFYGFAQGRETAYQHRLAIETEKRRMAAEIAYRKKHDDWLAKRRDRHDNAAVKPALAALLYLDFKKGQLQAALLRRAEAESLVTGLIDVRNQSAYDYLYNDSKLIEDAYANLVGAYRLWFARVQTLVLATEPTPQVTFDPETFELTASDLKEAASDPFAKP